MKKHPSDDMIPRMIEWHRLIGLTITDFFSGTSYDVELEKDLSVRQQFLDVVIIEKHSGQELKECPDGFDDLAKHNLLTYKSHRQVLDWWTIQELIGHYVGYRKLISGDALLPADDFRLYAISARFPRNLSGTVSFEPVAEGVCDIRLCGLRVRIIVTGRTASKPENAIWQLYSAVPEKVRYGAETYKWRKNDVSGVIDKLFNKYEIEGVAMPYTFEDFKRDYVLENIHELPPEDILERFSADDLLKRLSADERLKGFSADDLLKRLSADERLKGLSADDLFKRFSADDLLKRLSQKDIVPALRKQLSGLTPEEKKAFVDELLKSD